LSTPRSSRKQRKSPQKPSAATPQPEEKIGITAKHIKSTKEENILQNFMVRVSDLRVRRDLPGIKVFRPAPYRLTA
jgi:hypothetical protein